MSKVRFIKDAFVSGELFARKDEIKEINPSSSVRRWLKRGHELVEEQDEGMPIDSVDDLDENKNDDVALDLDAMGKSELLIFAEDKGIEVDKRLGVSKIRDKVREWLEENSEEIDDGH